MICPSAGGSGLIDESEVKSMLQSVSRTDAASLGFLVTVTLSQEIDVMEPHCSS